jgi:hypothetical protein
MHRTGTTVSGRAIGFIMVAHTQFQGHVYSKSLTRLHLQVRETVDAAEAVTPANVWPIATYRDLLFLDSQQDGNGTTTLLNLPY